MGPTDAGHELTEEQQAQRRDDARLVGALLGGDQDAFGALYDRWFDRVHDLARRMVHDTDAAADIAQDTFVRAWRSIESLREADAFGGWLLRITRNVALEHLRRAGRTVATGTEAFAVMERRGPSAADAPAGFRIEDSLVSAGDPSAVAERSEIAELLEGAVDALNERDTEVLDLQLRHGLTPAEIGDVLGVNRNAANQLVHRLRNRLDAAIRARVLWRGGDPRCADLGRALATAAVTGFGPDAVSVISRHAGACEECGERQRLRLDPAALFAAVPIIAAPSLLKARVAQAMSADGVPMGGSSALGPLQPPTGPDGATAPGRADTDGDVDGDGDVGDPDANPPDALRHRILLAGGAAAIVLAVLLAVVALDARRSGDSQQVTVATSVTTRPLVSTAVPVSTTLPGATSTSSPTTDGHDEPSDPPVTIAQTPPITTAPVAVAPTAPPAVTTTTSATVASPRVSVTLVPASAKRGWLPGGRATPVLRWSVTGAATVQVSGPGLTSSAASGSAEPCPTGFTSSGCAAMPGTYTYTVRARDGSGAVVAQRSATLTVVR